jgi:GDP-mannose 6-dehydrogenase
VVIRSTVIPGTVERIAERIAKISGKTAGTGFGIASNPEFLREGTSIQDFENPAYTVVGTADQRGKDALTELYAGIPAPLHFVRIREAELLKYACNAYHATKVAFANEIGSIAKSLGIDSHAVMNIFCEDTKLNVSAAYLKPGFAFGGSCLPKDVRAITHEARALDVETPLLNALIPSNDYQVERALKWVMARKRKNVGVLGLSFKSDTDDMRESPMVRLVETLVGKGYSVSIFDSNVNLSRVLGANRSYIEQEIPHISSLLKTDISEVIEHAEVLLVGNRGGEFSAALRTVKKSVSVLDLVRIVDNPGVLQAEYEGVAW